MLTSIHLGEKTLTEYCRSCSVSFANAGLNVTPICAVMAKPLLRWGHLANVKCAGMGHVTSHPQSLSQSAAIPTTVAMESGSWKNRLSQALTKELARGHVGLLLVINFHTPYLQKVPDNRQSKSVQVWLRGVGGPTVRSVIFIDLHTLVMTPLLLSPPINIQKVFEITICGSIHRKCTTLNCFMCYPKPCCTGIHTYQIMLSYILETIAMHWFYFNFWTIYFINKTHRGEDYSTE